MQLDPDVIKQYHEQGYIILKNFFSQSDIDTLKRDVKTIFQSASHQTFHPTDLSDEAFSTLLVDLFESDFAAYHGAAKVCNHLISFHQLSFQQKLLNCLAQLSLKKPSICARPLMWFHAQDVARSERYHRLPAHQEWSNMQGSLNGAVVWSPCVKISDALGKLQIIPGTHQLGLLDYYDEASEGDLYPFAIKENALPNQAFIEVDVDVTDALIFSSFLVHRSGLNTSHQIRWTFNFRYNDLADPSFIKRHFINPFQYSATQKIVDGFIPRATDL